MYSKVLRIDLLMILPHSFIHSKEETVSASQYGEDTILTKDAIFTPLDPLSSVIDVYFLEFQCNSISIFNDLSMFR